ncbi:MAG: hypothetical protein FWD99_09205 [Oscillospiraceae bacterium]|nr:hypothetical protein [Oscillospiraceae bacterium]
MDMAKRFDIIRELATKNPGLGKTAMMKYLFLLQQIYKMPLEYDFEIYTFGPYSTEVMEDIDFAECQNIISMKTVSYPSGHVGYSIHAEDSQADKSFSTSFEKEINELLKLFGEKNAKELELSTTTVYLYHNSKMNDWDCSKEAIAHDVHEIKPHFSLEIIKAEYDRLEANGVLKKVV